MFNAFYVSAALTKRVGKAGQGRVRPLAIIARTGGFSGTDFSDRFHRKWDTKVLGQKCRSLLVAIQALLRAQFTKVAEMVIFYANGERSEPKAS